MRNILFCYLVGCVFMCGGCEDDKKQPLIVVTDMRALDKSKFKIEQALSPDSVKTNAGYVIVYGGKMCFGEKCPRLWFYY